MSQKILDDAICVINTECREKRAQENLEYLTKMNEYCEVMNAMKRAYHERRMLLTMQIKELLPKAGMGKETATEEEIAARQEIHTLKIKRGMETNAFSVWKSEWHRQRRLINMEHQTALQQIADEAEQKKARVRAAGVVTVG